MGSVCAGLVVAKEIVLCMWQSQYLSAMDMYLLVECPDWYHESSSHRSQEDL